MPSNGSRDDRGTEFPIGIIARKGLLFVRTVTQSCGRYLVSNATISNISTLVCEYAHFALELNPMCPIASVGGLRERESWGERERVTHSF